MNKKLIVLLLVLTLIFTISCKKIKEPVQGLGVYELNGVEKIKVTSDKVNVKAGCSANENTLQTSDKNAKLDVISKVNDWYAVKLPDNQIGFVPTNECKPIVDDGKPDAGKTPTPSPGQTPGKTPTPGPGSTPTPDQPTTPPDTTTTGGGAKALTSQENEMLRLVNEARKANGVKPLQADTEVTNVARTKSQDMIDNNYFSHNSPTYGSPFDMLKSFGIKYVAAGENIAGNSSVKGAHDALMKSEGHRKNILNPDFTHIGIGIKKGGQYGNMFTQMFISKPK